MATAGAIRTKTQLIAAAGDAGDLADNSTNAILEVTMRNVIETLYGRLPYRTETASYSVAYDDCIVYCNHASTGITITLPDATAARMPGRIFIIKSINAAVVTMNTTSSQTIDGYASGALTINQKYQMIMVQSNGTNWSIIGGTI